MRSLLATSFSALLLVCTVFGDVASAAFEDTRYSWYADSIERLRAAGATNWFSDGTYRPMSLITRAEYLKILLTSANVRLDNAPSERCFGDIPVSDWAHRYACAARDLGIARGYGDGNFAPKANVTVLEALAMGFRAYNIAPPPLADGEWYEAYRTFADANEILGIHGYLLDTPITRGRAADLIARTQTYGATRQTLSPGTPGCLAPRSLDVKNTINVSGTDRSYNLYVPANYSKDRKYGLVVAFHGRTSSNDQVQGYMGLQGSRGSGRRGGGSVTQSDFIVAYPAGLSVSGGYAWGSASVEFFDAMTRQIADSYCLDREKIFVVGHSLGAGFANEIACKRAEMLRGVSAVAGPGYSSRTCTGPVAELLWHNQGDPLVSYASGKDAEWTRKTMNACSPDSSREATIGTYQCREWNSCGRGSPVVWCEGYRTSSDDLHGWPASGGSAILSFFRGFSTP